MSVTTPSRARTTADGRSAPDGLPVASASPDRGVAPAAAREGPGRPAGTPAPAAAARQRGGGLLVALLVILLAAAGQSLLPAWLGASNNFVLAYPALVLAAWYGGWWPGALTACVLAPLLPALAGAVPDRPTLAAAGLVLVTGLVAAALAEALHRARQRWQAQAQAVQAAQHRLADALDATGVMLLEFDTALRCTWVYNPPAAFESVALAGQPVEAFGEGEDGRRLRAVLEQVLGGGDAQRVDAALPGGGPCLEHCIAPLRDEAGRVRGVRSAATDVSSIRARQAQQAEVQALFRAAQERSPDAFELLRAVRGEGPTGESGETVGPIVDFVWEYVNPAAAALLGRRPEALLGQPLLGERADRFQRARFAQWCDAMAAGKPQRGEFRRDEPGRSNCSYQALALPLGERIAAMTCDATVPARSLEAERQQSAALQRAASLKDDFLAHLSHELRTPLNAITGWAHLLTRAGTDDTLLQRAAEAIGRNAHAQAVLVDALLDMNRIVTGSLRLERSLCDASAALQAALATAAPLAQAKWIRLHADDVATGVQCFGDAARLEQVFWNLLSNAVKFTPLGGDVWVVLERVDAGTALVEIRDTGEGVPAAVLPHFFDRFQQQAGGTRPHAGLGLGLTLVKSLVELHGGRVSVHSDGPGLGTTVRVHLPTIEVPGGRSPAAPAVQLGEVRPDPAALPHAGAPAAAPLTFRRILVLEDEADSLEVLSVLLRQQGAVVRAFDNAEQALAAAEHGSFDLVISDLGMPGMNGLEFMRRLQRRPLPLKAIALTAYAGEAERAEALKAGYTRVETKPISPPQFLAVVLAEVGVGEGG